MSFCESLTMKGANGKKVTTAMIANREWAFATCRPTLSGESETMKSRKPGMSAMSRTMSVARERLKMRLRQKNCSKERSLYFKKYSA